MVVSLLSALVLLVAVAGGSYGYLWYRYDQINKVHISDEVAVQNGAPFTILVIGSDSRVGESAAGAQAFGSASLVTGQRSDVVQLWRVTPATKQIQIVSIPRDTVVSMLPPDTSQFGTYNRINSSFNTGANQLVKTITANFGIPINHVVQVDFSGFQDAVQALGGVYMDFPYPAKDAYSGLDITTPGCQLLNGAQALAVARGPALRVLRERLLAVRRHQRLRPDPAPGRLHQGDDERRQVQVEPLSRSTPSSAPSTRASPSTTASGFNELIGLALTYHSYDPANLQGETLPTEAANGFGDLGDVLTVQQPQAQQMLVNIFGSSLVTPTNPPPNANGVPKPPPTVTPTTAAPATASGSGSSGAGAGGTTTSTTTPPPSFDPTNCSPS